MLQRIEAALLDEKSRRELLERSVQDLKQLVGTLQSRIEEIERQIKAP